jgi:formylglycine-generating enzyme required for sulfatase activity
MRGKSMKQQIMIWSIALASVVAESAQADELKAKITAVDGDVVQMTVQGQLVPTVGDPVEIFYVIPGLNTEASVAKGKVQTIAGDRINVKIASKSSPIRTNYQARVLATQPRPVKKTSVKKMPAPVKKTRSSVTTTPPLAIAPFDAKEAKKHQEAWAKHLGMPVEFTNSIGMKLKLIPAGDFLMGSAKSPQELVRLFNLDERDATYFAGEQPQHRVRITKPFYLGLTEVTQGQWESVMGTRPWSGESRVKVGTDYPATYMTWEDAAAFCRKLSDKEGRKYRPPTEAEWEYACRAGTTKAFHFGDGPSGLDEYAWWGGFRGAGNCREEKYPHRVGQRRTNTWGLYDMHGNVWEWCTDWYDEDYYGKSPNADPTGPATGSNRVIRGGAWASEAMYCRSALRDKDAPDFRGLDLGFRVALVPADASGS